MNLRIGLLIATTCAASLLASGCAIGADHADDHTGQLRYPAVPNADEGELRAPDDIRVGDCLNDLAPEPDGGMRVLACTSPHRFEVTAMVLVREDISTLEPATLTRRVISSCREGIGPFDEGSFVIEAFASREEPGGGTTFGCALRRHDLAQVTGTLRFDPPPTR